MQIWQNIAAHTVSARVVYKNEPHSRVCQLARYKRIYVIKRYLKSEHWVAKIKRLLGQDRVSRNIRHARALADCAIPTFSVVAHIEDKTHQYLIASYISGPSALALFKPDAKLKNWRQAAEALVALFFALYQADYYYRDWNFSNFIYHAQAFYLVDLDALQKTTEKTKAYWYARAKQRFFDNWNISG
ncbi:MAG: hypothetical protein V4490_02180, partial [Pseudomonadota bacterium]